MFLQKVSLKSHRSIINYPFGEFMSRKAGIKVEKTQFVSIGWSLDARYMGT